ncbi:MAG: DegT/DnrJ/EryC1/StrS family aminotransferase [Planctomycetota bacterium]
MRKRLDIGWLDLAFGMLQSGLPRNRGVIQQQIESLWSGSDEGVLACLSVRSGFDLLWRALSLPPGSEVLMSALTIRHMVDLVEQHHLVPVPVDVDVDHMAPKVDVMRRAITPNTKAIVVAHLFGSRFPMEPIRRVAREHNLLVIEDCAQAYAGRGYTGDPQADVSMFSFGPIKTATALWGAVLKIRDRDLLERMRTEQASYPVQSRRSYVRRLLKCTALKACSNRPLFKVVMGACRAMGRDHDHMINGSVRGFPGPDFFDRIRQQPCGPLLALLRRRLRTFSQKRLADRTSKGELLVDMLKNEVVCPAAEAVPHTHWVFPILVDEPKRVISTLRAAGFDATQGESMCVVAPPADRPDLDPGDARDALSRIVFLPLYPEMSRRAVRRMAQVLLDGGEQSTQTPTRWRRLMRLAGRG